MSELDFDSLLSTHQTPFYLFDLARLHSRIRMLRGILPEHTSLCYAVKANPFLAGAASEMVERLEICSEGEFEICRSLSLPAGQFVLSGLYKEPAWLQARVEELPSTVIYTVESMAQYALLNQAAHACAKKVSVLLRLTSGNQFGLECPQMEELLSRHAKDPYFDIRGIQYFSGTQKASLSRLRREIELLDTTITHLQSRCGTPIHELEFGPGFPVSYFQDDSLQEAEFLQAATALLARMRYSGKLVLELGRSIAADCGLYFTRVVDQKTNHGQHYAIVDGGIHQLVYYGQSLAMRRPRVTHHPSRDTGPYLPWTVCGSLCTVHDILAKQLPLRGLSVGDALVFENAGAYSMTEGIALFLSRELPQILLRLEDGSIRPVRPHTKTSFLNTPLMMK